MEKTLLSTIVLLAFSSGIIYSQSKTTGTMEAFKIQIEQKQTDELNSRINSTRWITESEAAGWGSSLDVKLLKELSAYWSGGYSWRKQEEYLNSFKQFKAEVKGTDIHFIYEKGAGSQHVPLLMLHGWGGSFTEYLQVVERMKKENPEFDLIVPSLPGFGFSATPESMSSETAAAIMHSLMTETLGYAQFFIHGGDYGAFVGEKIALDHPESVKGLHLADIPYYHMYGANENLSDAETKFMEKINNWSMMDGAYAMIQATRPKILSTGLNDSPVGLAAWMLQLHHNFTGNEKPLTEKFSKDALMTTVSLYWYTQTIYSSMRIYSEDANGFGQPALKKVKIPVGFQFHANDIAGFPPKEFAARFFENVVRWTEEKDGGHFAGMTHPEALQKDLLAFVKSVGK